MDHLAVFKIFLKCAETGSFIKAAADLGTNAPMVTRCIKKLEEEVGANLFIRTPKKVQLTDAGRNLIDKARNIIFLMNEIKSTGVDARSETSGKLRAYVPDFLFENCLARSLPQFIVENPLTELELMTFSGDLSDIRESFDIAIMMEPPPSSSGYVQKISSVEYNICAAPSYIAQCDTLVRPQDLKKYNCLTYNDKNSGIWTFSSAKSSVLEEVMVAGNLSSNNLRCILEASLAGTGIARLPRWLSAPFVETGELQLLFRSHNCTPSESGIYAITGERRAASLKISRFMDFVQTVVIATAQGKYSQSSRLHFPALKQESGMEAFAK